MDLHLTLQQMKAAGMLCSCQRLLRCFSGSAVFLCGAASLHLMPSGERSLPPESRFYSFLLFLRMAAILSRFPCRIS